MFGYDIEKEYLSNEVFRYSQFKHLSDEERELLCRASSSLLHHRGKRNYMREVSHSVLSINIIYMLIYKGMLPHSIIADVDQLAELIEHVTVGMLRACTNGFCWAEELIAQDARPEQLQTGELGVDIATEQQKVIIRIGSCVCLLSSFFNHSCNPNVVWQVNEKGIEMKALRNILPGETLSICYGPKKWNLFNERQERLKEDYCFYCICNVCRKDAAMSSTTLACVNGDCDGPVVINKYKACLFCEHQDDTAIIKMRQETMQKLDRKLTKLLAPIMKETVAKSNLHYLKAASKFSVRTVKSVVNKCVNIGAIRQQPSFDGNEYEEDWDELFSETDMIDLDRVGHYKPALRFRNIIDPSTNQVLLSKPEKKSFLARIFKNFYNFNYYDNDSSFGSDSSTLPLLYTAQVQSSFNLKRGLSMNKIFKLEDRMKQFIHFRYSGCYDILAKVSSLLYIYNRSGLDVYGLKWVHTVARALDDVFPELIDDSCPQVIYYLEYVAKFYNNLYLTNFGRKLDSCSIARKQLYHNFCEVPDKSISSSTTLLLLVQKLNGKLMDVLRYDMDHRGLFYPNQHQQLKSFTDGTDESEDKQSDQSDGENESPEEIEGKAIAGADGDEANLAKSETGTNEQYFIKMFQECQERISDIQIR